MKKLLILLLSMLISFNSYGEWMEISETDGVTFYTNVETIKEQGGYVYYWELDDFPSPIIDDLPIISAIIRKQVDCSDERMRSIVIHYYEQNMGQGDIYFSDDSPDNSWQYPPPGSSYYYLLNYVCDYVK